MTFVNPRLAIGRAVYGFASLNCLLRRSKNATIQIEKPSSLQFIGAAHLKCYNKDVY